MPVHPLIQTLERAGTRVVVVASGGGSGATRLSSYAADLSRTDVTDRYLNTCPFTQKSTLRRFMQ